MNEVFTPQHEMSEFNQGIAIIYRLDNILKQLHLARVEGNILLQYRWIKTLYIELNPNLNTKEQEQQLLNYKDCIEHEREIQKCKAQKGKIVNSLIDWVDIWEIDLRDLQQKHNLGMPKQRDARFAMSSSR